jgi:peroxiredoxin
MNVIYSLLIFFAAVLTTDSVDNGYDIGDIATDFNLENIDGKFVSLSNFNNAKGFIIVFTCNTCPYAVLYEDRIEALNKKYASQGYPLIAIMPNNVQTKPGDSMKSMKQRAIDKGFTFPYLMDAGQKIYPQYGATKTPHVYILESTTRGPVVRYIGGIDDNYKDATLVKTNYVEDAIEALKKGNLIKQTTTKAIGCSIKL